MDRKDLLQRRDELKGSLANATLNLAQAKRDLAEARDAEQRVRGAITLIEEFLTDMPRELSEVLPPGAEVVGARSDGTGQ